MKIIKYTIEYKQQWDNFIDTSKNGTFLLKRDFMEYHADRFLDHSILVFNKKNKLIAVFPANEKERNIVSHGGLTYGGLILPLKINLLNVISIFFFMIQYYCEQKYTYIFYKSVPSFYYKIPAFEEQYVMFLLKAYQNRVDTSFTTTISSNIKFQNRRERMVKKALKANVRIEKSSNFEDFWNKILTPNLLERFGTSPVHSLEEITYLHKKFPKNIEQYNAYINDDIVAGTTIFIAKNVPHAQYISASSKGRTEGAIDYLFSFLIREIFKNKKYFSFGISNEKQGQDINIGLTDWKEGLGGEVYPNLFYRIETKNYKYLEKFIQ